MPFENRSGVSGLEWMRLGVPFVLAERAEGFAKLRPVYGELIFSGPPTSQAIVDADAVAAFAKELGASWVFTGWVRRPDWKLELGISLYKVEAGRAALVREVVGTGDFKEVHKLIGAALLELGKTAKIVSGADNLALLVRESSADFYAFTLFGRGLWATVSASTPAEWERARKTVERAGFIDPGLTEAQRVLATIYRKLGKSVLAKARLEFVLKDRPQYAPAISSLARSTREHGQAQSARELFREVLKLRPWDLEARYELGVVDWELGKDEEAFQALSAVAKAQPDHIGARRALVLIHAKRSDTSKLVSELQAVAKLAPEDIPTRLDLAAALVAADRIDEAIDAYKGIEALDGKNVQALKFLGDLYRRQGQDPRAIRYYGLAIEAAPSDPRAYFLLGAMYVAAGDDDSARRIYLKAQRFAKFRAESYNNLGAIEFRRDRVGQSLWYLKRAVKLSPREARYHYNLALSLSRSRQAREALTEIEAALDLDPEDVESNYLHGVVLLSLGQAEKARDAFEATLARKPGHADAAHNLALLDEMRRKASEGEVVIEGR